MLRGAHHAATTNESTFPVAARYLGPVNTGSLQTDASFESLRLREAPILAAPGMRLQAPRLARIGEADGLLVYGQYFARGTPSLVSQRITGLFSDAAPSVGAAVVHLAKDNMNSMGPLIAWPDGSFAAHDGSLERQHDA